MLPIERTWDCLKDADRSDVLGTAAAAGVEPRDLSESNVGGQNPF